MKDTPGALLGLQFVHLKSGFLQFLLIIFPRFSQYALDFKFEKVLFCTSIGQELENPFLVAVEVIYIHTNNIMTSDRSDITL